jgi:plasmid replication initiation protein
MKEDKRMILKKYSILTHSNSKLTLNDRKILNYLLYLKQTQNSTDNIYYTSIKDIKQFLNVKYNHITITNSSINLTTKEIKLNILNKDKNYNTEKLKLLEYFNYNEDFSIDFKFTDLAEDLTTKDNLYTNLDLQSTIPLRSKYSLALYEFINDYKKVSIPTLTIDNFQLIMSSSYSNFSVLKEKVIDTAIKEIELKTIFSINYTTKRLGRKVKFINFTFKDITKNPIYRFFIEFMIKKHNQKNIKTKTINFIISKKLTANQWKIIFNNRDKLSIFSKVEFEYFVEQEIIKQKEKQKDNKNNLPKRR